MVIGGFLGDAELLASIADLWGEALGEAPSIPSFKMDHAINFKGPFYGRKASTREAKVRRLAAVIDRPELVEIYGRLDLDAFSRVSARWTNVAPAQGQRFHSLEEPYVNLAIFVITTAITEAVNRGATDPIKIIFDEQSLFRLSLQNSYSDFRTNGENDPKRLAVMPVQVDFEDDERFVVLQGADLVSGRRRLLAENDPELPGFVGDLLSRISVSRYVRDISDEDMEALHEHTVRFINDENESVTRDPHRTGCDD